MQPGDFIEPHGDLSEGMFPGVDLEEYVTAWLTDAQARTDDEARQRAWVYFRAYTSVANRLHAGLASERKADAAATVDGRQFAYWRAKAAAHLQVFQGTSASGVTKVTGVW